MLCVCYLLALFIYVCPIGIVLIYWCTEDGGKYIHSIGIIQGKETENSTKIKEQVFVLHRAKVLF